jgi:hypothetical protein
MAILNKFDRHPQFFEMTDKNDFISASSAPDYLLADRRCNLVPRSSHLVKRATQALMPRLRLMNCSNASESGLYAAA